MSKTQAEKSHNSDDELLAEYQFDYKKSKPNRFVNRRYLRSSFRFSNRSKTSRS